MAVTKKPVARTVTRDVPPDPGSDQRTPVRDNVIRNRAGQPVTLKFTGNEDKFAFDRSIIPEGWTYEWKTETVKGWDWIDHQVELAQNGWEPVPAERHDGIFMPRGFKGPIKRGGMILMERDERLTALARREERKAANAQIDISRNMAGLHGRAAPGAAAVSDYDNPEARRVSGVRVERQARVQDSSYQYEVDE